MIPAWLLLFIIPGAFGIAWVLWLLIKRWSWTTVDYFSDQEYEVTLMNGSRYSYPYFDPSKTDAEMLKSDWERLGNWYSRDPDKS